MLFEDKTLNNIMLDLKDSIECGMSTEEGTLIDHSFRGAAAEFERAYIGLGLIDRNGYAETADREHLALRAKERGIIPLPASNAEWKAQFNTEIPLGARFSAGELTYICTKKMEPCTYRIMCEQAGTRGNKKQGELSPIEYMEGLDGGELVELLVPARDVEDTEAFRARYFELMAASRAYGGNRAQYKQALRETAGVGPCKIYRVTQGERRIKIYFLDSLYHVPSASLVADVQEIMDPSGRQGEGEGEAAMFHVVDILPCLQMEVAIEADITIDTGYGWEELLPGVQARIDRYFLDLAKSWEDEERLIVRILKVNAAIAGAEGIVDVQGTTLNGQENNLVLDPNAVPVRGSISCRQQS